MSESELAKEKRWIVLGDDGRHVTLGRHSDPTDDEIDRAGEALHTAGLGGWLVVTEGSYYSEAAITLLMVRTIAPSSVSWDDACDAFQSRRRDALRPARKADGPSGRAGPS